MQVCKGRGGGALEARVCVRARVRACVWVQVCAPVSDLTLGQSSGPQTARSMMLAHLFGAQLGLGALCRVEKAYAEGAAGRRGEGRDRCGGQMRHT